MRFNDDNFFDKEGAALPCDGIKALGIQRRIFPRAGALITKSAAFRKDRNIMVLIGEMKGKKSYKSVMEEA